MWFKAASNDRIPKRFSAIIFKLEKGQRRVCVEALSKNFFDI
jgi:hypothetical protein